MKKLLVLAVAIMVSFAFALPATAQDKADWSFYGSARMWTAWESVDEDAPPQLASSGGSGFFQVGVTKARARVFGTQAEGDDEVAWLLQGNSRIGANVKWGNVGGRFEYGSGPNLRLLYGTWNFGPGTLTVGQDYGAYFYLISAMCGVGGAECNGIGFGSIYSGRTPQIKLTMGGFKVNLATSTTVGSFNIDPVAVAAATPQSIFLLNNQTTAGTGFVDTDQQLPKIEASYTFRLGPAEIFVGGAYNTYDEVYNIGGTEVEHTVDGWVLGAGTKMGFGPFYVNASLQYGMNPNNSGAGPYTIYPSIMIFDPATNQEQDADYLAAQLILGFRLSDAISFEGGLIYQSGEVDATGVTNRFEQQTYTYYLQMTWSPVKNVFFIPEFGMIDFNKLETDVRGDLDYGKTTWLGMKWMINF